jgi:Tfp pilus assembly protein PilX
MHRRTWLNGAALIPLFFVANAALAERESNVQAVGLGDRAIDAACAASGGAAQSTLCQDGRLLWGLCETGFRSERLPNAGVYACFLHSL